MLKPRHSAFFATPLDLLLQQMAASERVGVGLATEICVHLSARDAHLLGCRLRVPEDCTAAESTARKDGRCSGCTPVLNVRTESQCEPLAENAPRD